MAHALDNQKGFYGFLSYKETAWHGLGTVIDFQPKKVQDILKPAGLDFEVFLAESILKLPDGSELNTGSYSTYRVDKVGKKTTYGILGSGLGAGYQILQNKEVLEIVEPFFKDKKLSFETAGSLKDGKWTFACFKFIDPIRVDKSDIVNNYFVVFNSFDGSLSLMAYFTPVRVVCNNTLQMSFRNCKQKITLRHTANLKANMTEATKIILAAEQNGIIFSEKAAAMKRDIWKENRFFNYVAGVFCSPEEIKEIKGGHPIRDLLSTRKKNIINDVVNYAFDGVGQKEAGEMSAWWAYNAVTGYYSNQKSFTNEASRAESLYFGGSAKILETALAYSQPEKELPELGFNMN